MRTIVVGSRKSLLALTQTNHVISDLRLICQKQQIELDFTIYPIVTRGDKILNVTLSKVGGKGLFVKEIEQAMMDKKIDMAVHSMKDMPFELPPGLVHAAVSTRIDPRDCLIANRHLTLDQLKNGAVIGTSSLRRSSQLKAYCPAFKVEPIRGNIDSRLTKLNTQNFDAIILAAAGLHRIGYDKYITSYLSTDVCLPAVGQGALAIECRADDVELRCVLEQYNDKKTANLITAERQVLGLLNGGCHVPVAAHAVWKTSCDSASQKLISTISLTGLVATADGSMVLKYTATGEDPYQLGILVAENLIEQGAKHILAAVRR